MEINESAIKYIFNKKNVFNYIYGLIFTTLLVFISLSVVVYKLYLDAYNNYINILHQVRIPNDFSYFQGLELKCYSVNCKTVKVQGFLVGSPNKEHVYYKIEKNHLTMKYFLYQSVEPTFNRSWFSNYLTDNYNLIIQYNNGEYVINDNSYLVSAFEYGIFTWVVMLILIFAFNTRNIYYNYLHELYDKGNYKMYIENKLQGNITEMLHHEINTPLSIIKTVVSSYKNDDYTHPPTQEELKKRNNAFDFAVSRVEAVIFFLSSNKTFKQNTNHSIKEAATHVINNVNNSHIGKLILVSIGEQFLEKYTTDERLGFGQLLNILHVLITNSIEAGANKIVLEFNSLSNNNLASILVTDNGRGIRDAADKIFSNAGETITQYGISSKKLNGETKHNTDLITKILSKLGVKVITSTSGRGIGLYHSRVILRNAGGDIIMKHTSEQGTTFELQFYVRAIQK